MTYLARAVMDSAAENLNIKDRRSDYAADTLLIKKATAGDKDALTELCNVIARGVLYRVRYSMNNYTDAEDVSQEVLLQVCMRINELRVPEAFRVWLGKIIMGEINRFLKKGIRNRDVLNISDYIDAIAEDRKSFLPDECAEKDETRRTVLNAISKLPARQRQVVLFYYYDGLSISDIAEAMELANSSVSTHLIRARESIKAQLLKDSSEDNEKIANLNSMSMGIILFEAINTEAVNFSILNTSWLQSVLAQCQSVIMSETTAASIAMTPANTKTSTGLFVGKCAAICILGAVSCGILMIDHRPTPVPAVQWIESLAIGSGKVIFTGGETYRGTNRVNPLNAYPELDEDNESITISRWWVTTKENDNETLFHGLGRYVDLSELGLYENHQYGEYLLKFLIECESGALFRMSSNFYIKEFLR